MSIPQLGTLVRLDPRDSWVSESGSFTPWLAQAENLALLGQTIHLDLELEATEKDVGPFRADILCRDGEGKWVVIENQLERTDHSHLGQLLTYAAGLKAVTVVWVAREFTDEHRAALDWLNENTKDAINFFGLEIELWRIGDSPPAAKFNVVCQPNDWSESASSAAKALAETALTPTKQLQLEYWTAFVKTVKANPGPLRTQKPLPQLWTTLPLGRANVYLTATASVQNKRLGAHVTLGGDHGKAFFKQLSSQKDSIEKAFGGPLEWRELPDNKESQVGVVWNDADPSDATSWPKQHESLRATLARLHQAFAPRVKQLMVSVTDTDSSSNSADSPS